MFGDLRNITVSQSGGKWFVSIQTQNEVTTPHSDATSAVGIDVGIARFATMSNEHSIAPLNSFKKHQQRLARYQRRMSRKVKFSNNWKKAKSKVQKIHTDIANARIEFESGCVANITASRISMKNMRKSRFFQKDAYISVDFLDKVCEVVKMKDAPEIPGDFDMILQNAEGVKKQIYYENPSVEPNNAILDELESFADAINNNTTPVVTLEQATDALRVAYQIINCMEK